ncbi:MAG: hypothetical protein U5K79_00360 [Cyclobacteriaceae bacterium]|nr:hypothetical protein [Cyclobacteriaceae bacterium]
MKKAVFIIFILALLSAGAFFYLQHYNRRTIDPWKMVPANAILVYENSNLVDGWNKIIDKPVWKTLQNIPYFMRWQQSLAELDSLSGKNGTIDRLLRNKELIISMHKTAAENFDFLFTLDLGNEDGLNAFNEAIENLKSKTGITSRKRTYQGLEIMEIIEKGGKSTFTYFVYMNVVSGSFTPFLVEDVVRNIADDFKESFIETRSRLDGISKLENDDGNLYVDYARIPDFFATFFAGEFAKEVRDFTMIAGQAFLDAKVANNELLLNGVTVPDMSTEGSFIGTFRNQDPGKVGLAPLLPMNTAIVYHVAFSDFQDWQSQVYKYWSVTDKPQFDQVMAFDAKYNLTTDWVGHEAASAILDSPDKENPIRLAFVGLSDPDKAFEEIYKFINRVHEEQGDSLFTEVYNDLPIVQVPFAEFPAMLMGHFFKGYENTYATIYGNYLVMGNSMQAVKHFLSSINEENNWGKSIRQTTFLENTWTEANFSMIVNTSLCWPMLITNMNESWKETIKKYEPQIRNFDLLAIQVSHLDQTFHTSIAVGHQEKPMLVQYADRLNTDKSVEVASPIISKPIVVRNHVNNKREILLQDSLFNLYQVSDEGSVNWNIDIKQKIVTDIHQIDYFKNSKLQYLFATENRLHIIDRNGAYVEGYPKKLPGGMVAEQLVVVDYDNSKTYRFLISDTKGSLYLFDKEGNNLEGWTPRVIEGTLAAPPFHLRVKGGDCIVALEKKGKLHLLNRRGAEYPGFPVDFKVAAVEGVFFVAGNDFASSRLTTISTDGEIIEVNLKGAIVRREQFFKPSKDAKFWLLPDTQKKTCVIARQEFNKLSILNTKGEIILENNLISSGNLSVQFYYFAPDNQIFVVLDEEQEFAYIFNQRGEQVTFEPLECSQPVGLLYSASKSDFQLFRCFDKSLFFQTIR